MQTIYLADASRITIAEAKRLIIEKLEHVPSIDIFVSDDGDFEVRPNPSSNVLENTLHTTFADVCKSFGIAPRNKFNLSKQDYKGSVFEDEMYVMSHAEFVQFAQHNDIAVVVGDEPAAKGVPLAKQAESQSAKPKEWPLVRQKKEQGYNRELFRTMRDMRNEGLPRPKPSDILDRWRANPPEYITVLGDREFEYRNEKGVLKLTSIKSLSQVMDRISPREKGTTGTD
ncbi:MAG: hypothetical protein H7255_02010 [Ramlibacter sp.]|nr:hypothetical protein [Ramlibacter sp.]